MKIIKTLAWAVAAVAIFAACSKEENSSKKGGKENTVLLTIHRGGQDIKRSEGTNIGNGTAISFNRGNLYFTDATGVITKVFTIVTTAPAHEGQINMNAGVLTLKKIPSNSQKVYIVGNVDDLPISGNISQVAEKVLTVESQRDAAGKVDNVVLYGVSGSLTLKTAAAGGNDAVYEASVNVTAKSGRIEIDKFTATGDIITGYAIDGIFINNYYAKMQLQGIKTIGGDLVNNGTETDGLVPVIYKENSTQYPSTKNGTYFDFDVAGLGTLTGKVYTPKTTDKTTWSYNLLAPSDGNSVMPHIIIRFKEVTATPAINGYRYITVSGFKKDDDSVITTFDAGKIYRIKNFSFNEGDLDIAPEMNTITAEVTVTLTPWEEIPVNPVH